MCLRDVANRTKIPTRTLEEIERNNFQELPGGILTKGYLRAFAAEVDLNPEQVVRDYLVQWFGDSPEELPIGLHPPVEPEAHPGRLLLIEVIGTAALATSLWLVHDRAAPPPHATDRVATTGQEDIESSPALAPVPSIEPTPALKRRGIHLEIRPNGPCWVSAMADHRLVIYRLLQSGDRAVATARGQLVVRVGDPDACAYSVNGAPGRPLGPAGTPVTVTITEANYQTFWTSAPTTGAATAVTSVT